MKFLKALTLLLAVITTATLAQTAIFTPPNGFYVSPPVHTGVLQTPTSNPTKTPTWHVDQWGTMSPLGGFGVTTNTATSNTQRQVWYPSTSPVSWQTAVNGNSLTCSVAASGNTPATYYEFDALNEPNTNAVYPGYPTAGSQSPPLSTMTSLTHTLSVQYVYYATTDTLCSVATQATILTAVVLHNTVDGTTIFYQLHFVAPNALTSKQLVLSEYYASGPSVWGFDDTISSFNATPPPLGGGWTAYSFNLLPKLISTINNSTLPDKALAHWVVNGTYHGVSIWGHEVMTVNFENFSLTYQ